jgi:ABC-type nitrate/sulfonate/bicarbonate transport system substrate-binding protein
MLDQQIGEEQIVCRRIRLHRLAIAASFVLIMLALPAPTAMASDVIRVALPVAVDIPYAVIYAAEDLGYYAQKGIDVEITSYRGAGAAQEAMAAGAADIVNLVPSGAAVAVSKGLQEQIVACGPQISPSGWYLLTLAKSPIQSVSDLDGKRVAVSSKNSTTDFYALWMANKYGIKIETVPLGGSEWPALRSGQVEAIIRSSGDAFRLLLDGEVRSILDFGAVMDPNIPECWVATKEIIRNKPAAVRAFVEAVGQAVQKMQNDKAYTLAYLRKYLDEKDDRLGEMGFERLIKQLTPDGDVDIEALRNSLRLTAPAGLTNLPDAEELVADIAVRTAPNK